MAETEEEIKAREEKEEAEKKVEEEKKSIEAEEKANMSIKEAQEVNKVKAELLEREEKLTKRKEDLVATQMVGGHTVAGETSKEPEQISDSDYADKFMKGEANPLGEDGISLD